MKYYKLWIAGAVLCYLIFIGILMFIGNEKYSSENITTLFIFGGLAFSIAIALGIWAIKEIKKINEEMGNSNILFNGKKIFYGTNCNKWG